MNKKAYSYIRFSQHTQAKGGSLERQDTRAQQYAASNGLLLDTTLNMRDLGVSGYTGQNLSNGALGRFLEAVDAGTVQSGSYLLIEDIDRLSRLPVMEALPVFQSIISKDIIIVTLSNGNEYSLRSLNSDWTGLMPLLVSMGRANEESTRKSYLLSKAWAKKKAAAAESLVPLGNTAPLWMTYTKLDGYKLDPLRADLVRRIFQMSIAGRGREAICKILNDEGIPAFKGGTWGITSISRILSSRAVIGEYIPRKNRSPIGDPIPNFFPAVLDLNTFHQAQAASASRRNHRSTKQPQNYNLWSGIAKCGKCFAAMHIIKKVHTYLSCANKRKGICNAKPVRLDESELVFKEILAAVGDNSLIEHSSAALSTKLQSVQGNLIAEQTKYTNTKAIFDESPSIHAGKALAAQEANILAIQAEIDRINTELATDKVWDKDRFFSKLDLVSYEGRNRANGLLKRLKITITLNKEFRSTEYLVYYTEPLKIFSRLILNPDGTIKHTPLQEEFARFLTARESNGDIDNVISGLIDEEAAAEFEGRPKPPGFIMKELQLLKNHLEEKLDILKSNHLKSQSKQQPT